MDGVEPDDERARASDGGAERYPEAPLPPHERVWRHPSEVGEASWRRSEPPLTIGRGLLLTTGAIGGLLALAVLWAMLPTATGGGNAVSTEAIRPQRSAASSVRATPAADDATTLGATTLASTSTSGTSRGASTAATSATSADADIDADTTVATEDGATSTGSDDASTTAGGTGPGSSSTSSLSSGAGATLTVDAGNGPSMAIAVAVSGVPVVLTTAAAVRDADGAVTLAFADGRTAEATVAMTVSGIAVLTTDDTAAAATFKLAGAPHDGDQVTLLGDNPATVAVRVDTDGGLQLQSWGDGDLAEGTPVLDERGRVVALCSKGGNGPKLVTIDQKTLRNAVDSASASSTATPGKPYLGVYLNADPSGSLTINAVDPNGPAAAAGIAAGDTIVAIDGDALADKDGLDEVLADHVPDDGIAVTVAHLDGSQATFDVVLAVSPTRA